MYRRYENNNSASNHSRPANNTGTAFRRPQNHTSNRNSERGYEHRNQHHSHNGNTHHHSGHNHSHHHRRDEHDRSHHQHHNHHNDHSHSRHEHHSQHNEHNQHTPKKSKNPILGFIPTSIYNPEDGKILGFLTAEDLLLIAMILMFLDSEEEGDNLMVYALLYVLASEWIDMDFFKKFI